VCLLLSGCITTNSQIYRIKDTDEKTIDIVVNDKTMKNKTENMRIEYAFQKDIAIIKAFERYYGGMFDIAKNFLQYKKENGVPTWDGFYVWVAKRVWYRGLFDSGDVFKIGQSMLDDRFNSADYIEIKKNYELFERIGTDEK
jgi:hypothetical protein